MDIKPKTKMSNTNLIGFGITLGSLIIGTILICFFGNNKEVLCVYPTILLGMYLYTKKQNKDMTVGEKIDLLVNATDDYAEIRLKTSDQFIEMMKFMYKDKYKLIEHKEKEYFKMLDIIKSISDGLKPKQR